MDAVTSHTIDLDDAHRALRKEAIRLAGELTDLEQRATVYRHVFRDSGGNHAFPLIAAHGALWARGYFAFGLRLGKWLSLQYCLTPEYRRLQLQRLDDFANAFREVNRQVCIDTYTNYHLTKRFADHPDIGRFVASELLESHACIHAARRNGRRLSSTEMKEVFTAHFLYEQQFVVGPRLEEAVTAFDWPVAKWIALRPVIRFAYFPASVYLRFRNFARREDRIEKGMQAFDMGAAWGWDHVEQALRHYAVLPDEFFTAPADHFARMRNAIRAGV